MCEGMCACVVRVCVNACMRVVACEVIAYWYKLKHLVNKVSTFLAFSV